MQTPVTNKRDHSNTRCRWPRVNANYVQLREKLHLFLSCDCHAFTVAVNAYLSVAVICLAHPAKQITSTSLHILSTGTTLFQAQ